MRLRTRNQIEMKYYVGRLRKTMSNAMPKRVLACTIKTFKKFKAVSAHNRLFSKQTTLWLKKSDKDKVLCSNFCTKTKLRYINLFYPYQLGIDWTITSDNNLDLYGSDWIKCWKAAKWTIVTKRRKNIFGDFHAISNDLRFCLYSHCTADMPEKVKLPPLLCMTVNKTGPARSEYRFSFTPKVKLVQPHIKLASSFMYRRPPDSIRGQPRESFQPGFVPAARSGWLDDYVFLHSNAFYSNNKEKRTYFTVRPDWVSERCVRKNNPFS